jgi:Secretion system C-terminal sorting domain
MNNIIKILIFTCFLNNVLYAQNIITPPQTCSDLFITELTFGKNPRGNGQFDLNYAIEIFNSSSYSINLSNYTLQLRTSTGSISTIPLNGTLSSHDVFVVGNNNADLNLQSLCDQLSVNLDFEINVDLELIKGSTIIDKIGIGGSSIPQSFDLIQFYADPYNYLLNFHFDLNDYQNIDVRRSLMTQQGNPNFNSSFDIVGEWFYKPNFDRSDIGQYVGGCNKPLGMTIIGFNQNPPDHTDLYPCHNGSGANGGPFADYFNIVAIGNDPGSMTFTEVAGGTATISGYNNVADLEWNLCANCTNSTTHNSSNGTNTTGAGLDIAGLGYLIDKTATVQLTSSIYTIDGAKDLHWIWLKACAPTGIEELKEWKNDFVVYPTITSTFFKVKSKRNFVCKIISMDGRVLKDIKNGYSENQIDISNFQNGMYFVLLHDEYGNKSQKLIQKF